MNYFSMFSGIGGFETAIDYKGSCIGYSEIDKYAIKVYEQHFPTHKNYGNATTINTDGLPDFDLLVGGFPCQAFSIAGKRKGFEDTRGTLFFDIARILRAKQPRNFILENVKGLLSHDSGQTFKTIITTLAELGYCVEWQVLNSKNHGVPQNRERVFIVGHFGGQPTRTVFPFSETNRATLEGLRQKNPTIEIAQTIRTRYGNGSGSHIMKVNNPTHSNNRVYSSNGLAPTLNTMQGGNRQPKIVIPVLTPDRIEKRQNGRRFKEDGDESFTLTAQDKHGIFDGVRIRRLTPVECERLQGFPDDWTAGISTTQRYKCIGNAVTVNVVKSLINVLY